MHILKFNSFIIILIIIKIELSTDLDNENSNFSFESIENDGLFKDLRLYRQSTVFMPRGITLISIFSSQ